MMDGMQPIITKKKLIIVITGFLVLFSVGAFVLLYKGPAQKIAYESDQMLDYAAPNSKIADIQVLVTVGRLSNEQYTAVYRVLNTELPEMEPEASYFAYIPDTLALSTTQEVDEDAQDAEEGIWLEDVVYDLLLFEMTSGTGAKYRVTVDMGEDLNGAKTTIEKE